MASRQSVTMMVKPTLASLWCAMAETSAIQARRARFWERVTATSLMCNVPDPALSAHANARIENAIKEVHQQVDDEDVERDGDQGRLNDREVLLEDRIDAHPSKA